MAEEKFVQYGDKQFPMGDMTLDAAKAVMARHFPELAEPKIDTQKTGDKTVYVFTKQAGRKGAAVTRDTQWTLGKVKENGLWVEALLPVLDTAELVPGMDGYQLSSVVLPAIREEADQVGQLRSGLDIILPDLPLSGNELL